MSSRNIQYTRAVALIICIGALAAFFIDRPVEVEKSVSDAAWRQVRPRLDDLDKAADDAAAKRLAGIQDFFNQRRPGANGFAAEVLSWSGKWELIKHQFGYGDHPQYVADTFRRHTFTNAELQAVIEAAVQGYLSDL